ncbi:hypothetical protein O3P69_012901 [Scylla paramamosain]|uniref:Uncharacterized protein n=1 Tax=Scylla paramamosain TaxID=85552 RepID=A0AAW0TR78_SCYPA
MEDLESNKKTVHLFFFFSKGFLTFPPGEPEHDRLVGGNSHAMDHVRKGVEDPKMIKDYNNKTKGLGSEEKNISSDDSDDDHEDDKSNDEAKDQNEKEEEKEDSTDDEHCNNNEEREVGSGGNSSGNSKSSKRTSILTGSDLPQDSPKDDTLSKDSSKSSKGSTNPSHWLVEQYLLTPQQKLKLALYDGRKFFAAGEGDGAVREFVRARALAQGGTWGPTLALLQV